MSPQTATPSSDRQQAGPLLAAVLVAQQATHDAMDGAALRDTVNRLVLQARQTGATVIYGGSEPGQQLAGAMAYADPDLHLWRPGEEVEHVLIIEGALAGLAGPYWHMAMARRRGAGRADVLALSYPVESAQRGDSSGSVMALAAN